MEPAYSTISPLNIGGVDGSRLMVVIKTGGCEYALKTGGGCTVCGFMNHSVKKITGQDMVRQLDHALQRSDMGRVGQIDLLTLGSFLNHREVDGHTREKLLGKIARLSHVRVVSFESRAEYVTVAKLKECKKILGDKTLEFGIGLESSDNYIRNKIIKKGLSAKGFEDVVKKVKDAGCDLLVYLLVKPPTLSERGAVEDAVKSAFHVFETARQHGVKARVAFEPVFICENTYLEELFLNGRYRLVNLWSVVEVIKRTHHLGHIFVGLSDENLSNDRLPDSCPDCRETLKGAIEAYNGSLDITLLDGPDCPCRAQYLDQLNTM